MNFISLQARQLLPLLLLGLFLSCAPQEETIGTAEDPAVPIVIETGKGSFSYRAEVAATPAEQQRGLMYRQEMARDRGMLFPFPAPRVASFWMKNTYLPLDMIFIAADGRIDSIAADTVPLTAQSYRSHGPVTAVLELNAGEAERIGARAGDRVIYELP